MGRWASTSCYLAGMLNLLEYLQFKGNDPATTKLHVIRGKSARANWSWDVSGQSREENLLDYALRETCCNDESRWKFASDIAVLLSTDAAGSPYRHVEDAFLYLGIIRPERRREGLGPKDAGTVDAGGWIMHWVSTDGTHLLENPLMKKAAKGWDYKAIGGRNTSADQFTFLGRADLRLAVPTPARLRGFRLGYAELVDRLTRPNWLEFLDAAGVYLIQVYSPEDNEFFRYVGKATSFRRRWKDYADSGGTGGSSPDNGNIHLVALRQRWEATHPGRFEENWRIQIVRVCDTDEVGEVESEVKLALCTYNSTVVGKGFDGHQSAFGLNGN